MTREEIHERIEAYLNGTLPPEEMERMSQAIVQDSALADEVELHRSLHHMLADREYLDLRQKLSEISDAPAQKNTRDPGKPSPRNWLLLAAIGLVVLVLIWVMMPRPTSEPAPPPIPAEEHLPDTPADDEPATPDPDIVPGDTPAIPDSAPVHDPYAPLARLEQALNAPADPIYEVVEGRTELFPEPDKTRWQFLFRGQLRTALDPPTFELHIFNNRGARVHSLPVTLQMVDEDAPVRAFARKYTYLMQAGETLLLTPGLYYARLYRADTREYLWTGREEVR